MYLAFYISFFLAFLTHNEILNINKTIIFKEHKDR